MSKRCPYCTGKLAGYDTVTRYIYDLDLNKQKVIIQRMKCKQCKKVIRILPEGIFPYKQYSSEVIQKVVSGEITSDILKYEDYPSEQTMKRWKKEFTH